MNILSTSVLLALGSLTLICGACDRNQQPTPATETGAPPSTMVGDALTSPSGMLDPHAGLDLKAIHEGVPGMEGALPPGHPTIGDMGANGLPAQAEAAPKFEWTTPAGWRQIESTMLRDPNFIISAPGEGASGEIAECYVATLTGAAGGREANINRWRDQMGLPAAAPEEIAGLETIEMLGVQSTLVDLSGDFRDMAGAEKKDNRMLAAIAELPDHSIFVKMTGPNTMVDREKANFIAFCKSLRLAEAK